jgi:hypothetical protein
MCAKPAAPPCSLDTISFCLGNLHCPGDANLPCALSLGSKGAATARTGRVPPAARRRAQTLPGNLMILAE